MTTTPSDEAADLAELIAKLEAQEVELVFRRFTNGDAWRLGSLLVETGNERGLPITIDIRRHGHQLFHAALDGTAPDNDEWIERKVRVVDRYSSSSFLFGRRLESRSTTLGPELGVDPAEYAPHGGAFPIRIEGVGVVGSVTVSGLPQADDHSLVVEAVRRFLRTKP